MSAKQLKLVTIGGGSSYTPELIEGYIKRKDQLPIKEIWLVDIPEGEKKLSIVGAMAKRMIAAAGLDWEVHLTLDRRAALKDADFVSTQFRVGLLEARVKDERIPGSFGLIGQETNGAGGIFKAFRTVPVILDIVKDMKELCPNAWLINFTNPSGMITEAIQHYGKWDKVIGLCNVPVMAMINEPPPHIRITISILQLITFLASLYGILTFQSPLVFVLSAIVMAGLILSLMNTLGFYSHPHHKRSLKRRIPN